MNPEVKEKWLAALRSGEYKQTTGSLRIGAEKFSHCCLGVLCELYVRDGVDGKWSIPDGGDGINTTFCIDGEIDAIGFPPTPVVNWAGINEKEGLDLAAVNDATDSFDKPIKWIEANL